MQMATSLQILLTLMTLFALSCVEASKENYHCDICRAVVREANWKVSQVDPKKLIQVGSFRVDPDGNQNIKEKKYSRSESYIEDVFESICDNLQDYAQLTKEDGSKEIVRFVGIDGTRLNTKDFNLDKDIGKKLRYKCHNFLEDNEEVMISLLQRDNLENYETTICGDELSVCTGNQLSQPVTELPIATKEEPDLSSTEEGEGETEESAEEDDGAEEELPVEATDSSNTKEKEEL